MKCFVLNGWAASGRAWDLCRFPRERVFSYVEQLDGLHRKRLEEERERAVIVGWSMGASMALSLAMEMPEKVGGIVLVAATPRMMEDKPSGWRGMSPRRLDALRRGLELTRGEGFAAIPDGRPNPYMMDEPANLERGLGYLRETDLRERLEAAAPRMADMKIRIFQSRADGIVRADNAEYLSRIFPSAGVVMVDGTEHALSVAVPELIDEAVFDIMAGK
jgi:pimeloyl-[acyl-carrier protein] methyl ester esterase